LKKANLLLEERYISERISGDLKNRAFDKAQQDADSIGDDTNQLEKRKRINFADRIQSHVNPEIKNEMTILANQYGYNFSIDRGVDAHSGNAVASISLYFILGDNQPNNPNKPSYYDYDFAFQVFKDKYFLKKNKSDVNLPEVFQRRMIRMIKRVQEDL